MIFAILQGDIGRVWKSAEVAFCPSRSNFVAPDLKRGTDHAETRILETLGVLIVLTLLGKRSSLTGNFIADHAVLIS